MNDLRFLRRLGLTLVALAMLSGGPTKGQSLGESTSESALPHIPNGSVGSVRQADPKVYYLLDSKGNLIPVLDFSFEKHEELRKLDRDLRPAAPPRFEFPDLIRMTGVLRSGYLELEAVVPIRFIASDSVSDETWVRIPLRLSQAIRYRKLKYQGPSRRPPIVESSEIEGHVVWIHAKPDTDHTLTLSMKVAVETVVNETRFSVVMPPHASEIVLTISEADLEANFLNDSRGILKVRSAAQEKTELVVQSMGGKLELAWRKKNEIPVVLKAEGTVMVQVAGDQISCDARLTVSSPGRPIQSILVRLPPQMELIPSESGNPSLQLDVEGMDAEEGRRVRAHRRDGRLAEEFDVRLQTVRTRVSDKETDLPLEIAGFEVSGARIQSGILEFQIEEELSTEFIPGDNVRQNDRLSDSLTQRDVDARFRYSRQPFSLQLRVRPKESQVHVVPRYVVFVDADQARLEATLRYRISGARAQQLELDLDGWHVDRVLPTELLSESISRTDSSPLLIPLASGAYPLPGEVEFSISAHKAITPDHPFSFVLPRPSQRTTKESASLAIVPADNVELASRTAEIKGLLPDETDSADMDLPSRQQPPLFFLEESSVETPTFVADVRVRERKVSVAASSSLRISETDIEVEQRFNYQIDFETLSTLRLAVPDALVENKSLQVKLHDKVLDVEFPSPTRADDPQQDQQNVQTAAIHFPEDQIGRCEVSLRYVIPASFDSPGVDPLYDVPLILPADSSYASLEEHQLEMVPDGRLQVSLVGSGWSLRSASIVETNQQQPIYEAEDRGESVTVAVAIDRSPRPTSTRLQRVWVQTWFSEASRRDRTTFQLTTNESRLQFQLPSTSSPSEVKVFVNGRDWAAMTSTDAERVDVELDNPGMPQNYTVELWYWIDSRPSPLGQVSVAYLTGSETAQRVYWQLVLPQNEHLLWAPVGLTPEYQWKWKAYRWGRQSNLGLRDLESRLATLAQDSFPTAQNEYLFSTISPINQVDFHTVDRATIVVFVSGATLLFGLMLIYSSVLRSPISLLVIGVAVLSIGLVFPEPTVFAVQAGVLGWTLTLVAQALKWSLGRSQGRLPAGISKVAGSQDSTAPERVPSITDGSSRLATTVAPSPFSAPTAES